MYFGDQPAQLLTYTSSTPLSTANLGALVAELQGPAGLIDTPLTTIEMVLYVVYHMFSLREYLPRFDYTVPGSILHRLSFRSS
jgi:hypothetical protein